MSQDLKNITVYWDDNHRYSPAPRHRRRLICKLLRELPFNSCLDAGCAQPYLLFDLHQQGKEVFGCDLSDQVITSNRTRFPFAGFAELDITKSCYPGKRQFDLVISSEVLEHIKNWPAAVKNLCSMAKKYILLTVPSGPIRAIDRRVGHVQHFRGPELTACLEQQGFEILQARYWGFPLHSCYKFLINHLAPEQMYANFSVARYGWLQKILSQILYGLFFINDCFSRGQQFFCLASRRGNYPAAKHKRSPGNATVKAKAH